MARLCALAACLFALTVPLGAQEAKESVKDDAKLFKPETIKKAEETARALAKKGIQLMIATYPTIPPGMTEKVKQMNAKEREAVFEEWSKKQLEKLGPGILQIVLTDDPKHLQVTIGADVIKKGFTAEDRQKLTRAMLEKLNKNQIDAALEGALSTLRSRLDAPPPDDKSGKAPDATANRARELL